MQRIIDIFELTLVVLLINLIIIVMHRVVNKSLNSQGNPIASQYYQNPRISDRTKFKKPLYRHLVIFVMQSAPLVTTCYQRSGGGSTG